MEKTTVIKDPVTNLSVSFTYTMEEASRVVLLSAEMPKGKREQYASAARNILAECIGPHIAPLRLEHVSRKHDERVLPLNGYTAPDVRTTAEETWAAFEDTMLQATNLADRKLSAKTSSAASATLGSLREADRPVKPRY